MNPSLPQDDPNPEQREAELGKARDLYRYNYDHLPGAALADTVPGPDSASAGWLERVGEALLAILINHSKSVQSERWSCKHETQHSTAVEMMKASPGGIAGVLDRIVSDTLGGDIPETKGVPIDAYAGAFHEIRLPWCALAYNDDLQFGAYRTRGPNPMEIKRISALDDRFPVTDMHFRYVMGRNDSLAAAGAEGRLYLTDYGALDGLTCGRTASGRQKYLAAPLALFAVSKAGALLPVAIQLGQRPGEGNPIVRPNDQWAWALAKAHVQAADGNMHQAVRHLAHTHLVLDPFVMALRRQLSPSHPLSVLLAPHFEGTLSINYQAWRSLLADGGGVDIILAGEIAGSRAVAVKAALEWSFDDSMFPKELARRGVDDAAALPSYPYRDDGRLLWDALHAWVESYLRIYYGSSADVGADTELQAWVAEIVAPRPHGGQIKGFGQDGGIKTLEYLIDAVTHIIFTGSVQHAAVNFPQYQMMSYVPKMPLALFEPPPSNLAVTEVDYLRALPPLNLAYAQCTLGFLLGSVRHTKLGQYEQGGVFHGAHFRDPRVAEPLAAFQRRLAEIEETKINPVERRYGYDFLVPSNVPQSINI